MTRFERLRAWLFGDCRSMTGLVSASQERSLSPWEKLGLKRHLMMCSGCRSFSRQIPFLRQAMRAFAQGKANTPRE